MLEIWCSMSSGDGSEAVSQDSPASPPPEGEMAKPPERIGGDDDNKGDSTGTGSNELDSVVTDPSTLIVYANAPAESSATMPHQLLLPAVQQVPAAVQVKKGVRKHTWEDEMVMTHTKQLVKGEACCHARVLMLCFWHPPQDILVLQGKRRARLEAGVRDNNLRWVQRSVLSKSATGPTP